MSCHGAPDDSVITGCPSSWCQIHIGIQRQIHGYCADGFRFHAIISSEINYLRRISIFDMCHKRVNYLSSVRRAVIWFGVQHHLHWRWRSSCGYSFSQNIVMVLTNSYPFINSLLDPIAEAHDQHIELGYPSSGPSSARPNHSGESFLFPHCLKRRKQCENESGSWERAVHAVYTLTSPIAQCYTVAARHMRQLRPGLGRASPVLLGKRTFFLRKRNQIRVSLYVSHNTRWVSRSLNPKGVVKTMIVRHWVRASGTLRATSRHWLLHLSNCALKLFVIYRSQPV